MGVKWYWIGNESPVIVHHIQKSSELSGVLSKLLKVMTVVQSRYQNVILNDCNMLQPLQGYLYGALKYSR